MTSLRESDLEGDGRQWWSTRRFGLEMDYAPPAASIGSACGSANTLEGRPNPLRTFHTNQMEPMVRLDDDVSDDTD
jgi:hypothetical protein